MEIIFLPKISLTEVTSYGIFFANIGRDMPHPAETGRQVKGYPALSGTGKARRACPALTGQAGSFT
jgi:hypothetical protein